MSSLNLTLREVADLASHRLSVKKSNGKIKLFNLSINLNLFLICLFRVIQSYTIIPSEELGARLNTQHQLADIGI